MSNKFCIYENSGGMQIQRMEFTPGAMEGFADKGEKIAREWFVKLQNAGLISTRARFEALIPKQKESYKTILLNYVKEIGSDDDVDNDGLYDISSEELTQFFENKGLFNGNEVSQDNVATALLCSRSLKELETRPSSLVPYDKEYSRTYGPEEDPPISEPPEPAQETFNPYRMSEVIEHFMQYKNDFGEFARRLPEYLSTYYTHVDKTSMRGFNVSDRLIISADFDLNDYFNKRRIALIIDCFGYAGVGSLITYAVWGKNVEIKSVLVGYFGRKVTHIALMIRYGETWWILNNNSFEEFIGVGDAHHGSEIDVNSLVRRLSNGYYAVSQIRISDGSPRGLSKLSLPNFTWDGILTHPVSSIRYNAVTYLKNNFEFTPEATGALINALSKENDPNIREDIIKILGKNFKQEMVEGILAIVFDTNPRAGFEAAGLLLDAIVEGKAELSNVDLTKIDGFAKRDNPPRNNARLLEILFKCKKINAEQFIKNLERQFSRVIKASPPDEAVISYIAGLLAGVGAEGLSVIDRMFIDKPGTYPKEALFAVLRALCTAKYFNEQSARVIGRASISPVFGDLLRYLSGLAEKGETQKTVMQVFALSLNSPFRDEIYGIILKMAKAGSKIAVSVLVQWLDSHDPILRDCAFNIFHMLDGGRPGYDTTIPIACKIMDPNDQDRAASIIIERIRSELGKESNWAMSSQEMADGSLWKMIEVLGNIGGEKACEFLNQLNNSFNPLYEFIEDSQAVFILRYLTKTEEVLINRGMLKESDIVVDVKVKPYTISLAGNHINIDRNNYVFLVIYSRHIKVVAEGLKLTCANTPSN